MKIMRIKFVCECRKLIIKLIKYTTKYLTYIYMEIDDSKKQIKLLAIVKIL